MGLDESFFHNEKKGCKLVSAQKVIGKVNKRGKTEDRSLYYQLCLPHGVDVCRCGWEFSHHPVSQQVPHFTKKELMEYFSNVDVEKTKTNCTTKKVTYSR